jgi:Fe-S oxidoreductase
MVKELKEYRSWAWNCFRDSMCKHVFTWHVKSADYDDICPPLARYQFDCYSAQGKMGDLARCLIEGEIEWSDKLLDVIYNDPICGACSYICGRITDMQPSDVIQAMRAQAVKDGQTLPGGFQEFLEGQREFMNPYRKKDEDRIKWVSGLPSDLAKGINTSGTKTKTLLYVGCFPLRDEAGEKMARDAVTVLLKAGVDVGILGETERCCGNPSLRLGDTDSFVSFAKENIKQFNEMGIERLVTICPFCYSTFKRDYPDIGEKMNFEVVHILPLVDQLIKEGKLKLTRPVNLTVTYHDPCHLSRLNDHGVSGTDDFSGICWEPRNILNSIPGINFVEMNRVRDDSWCCGAGSWLRNGYYDMAQWTAQKRIEEAKATGAEALVTYCPHCEENLTDATSKDGDGLTVYDLLDLVLKSL